MGKWVILIGKNSFLTLKTIVVNGGCYLLGVEDYYLDERFQMLFHSCTVCKLFFL